jgi:hypothetical protein
MNYFKKHILLTLIIIYIFNNIFIFFNNGLYWDDWCAITPESMKAISNGVGTGFLLPLHTTLFNLNNNPALTYHIIILALEATSLIFFYYILFNIKIDKKIIFILILLYILLPYNESKIHISTFNYTFGIWLYLISTLLFIYNIKNNRLYIRLISLLILFCSLVFLPSLIIFSFGITGLFCFYDFENEKFNKNYKIILIKFYKKVDYIIILILFWIIRSKYFMPTGSYAKFGYRSFTFTNIIQLPVKIVRSFYDNIISLHNILPTSFSIIFIASIVLIYILFKKLHTKIIVFEKRQHLLFLGLYLFLFATFAYSILGLTPEFGSVNSRHQILIKFAAPFLILYILTILPKLNFQNLFLSILVTSCVTYSFSSQLKFQKSWFKQLALEQLFKKQKNIVNGDNFLIYDNTTIYNEYNTRYEVYCLNGILYKSLGNQSHIAIDSKTFELQNYKLSIDSNDMMYRNIYHLNEVKNFTTLNYSFIIDKGVVELSLKQNLKMLYQKYFNPIEFDKSLNKIISLKYSPCVNY